jgi:hypothetical protein
LERSPSLRRHDPDQVRRVTARVRCLSPRPGSPWRENLYGTRPRMSRPQKPNPRCLPKFQSMPELAAFHHSITSSASNCNELGTSMPSALAVLRLITNSYLVGCWTGRSAVGAGDTGDNHRHRRLLRARRERPADSRAAEKRDELAASYLCSHSITSSARASSVGGISRPSALAVLRLMINSKRVGCSTGKSPGFAPFKIFPT